MINAESRSELVLTPSVLYIVPFRCGGVQLRVLIVEYVSLFLVPVYASLVSPRIMISHSMLSTFYVYMSTQS